MFHYPQSQQELKPYFSCFAKISVYGMKIYPVKSNQFGMTFFADLKQTEVLRVNRFVFVQPKEIILLISV